MLTLSCTSKGDAEPSCELLMVQTGCLSGSARDPAREAGTPATRAAGRQWGHWSVCPSPGALPRCPPAQGWQQHGTIQLRSPSPGWQGLEKRAGSISESSPEITPQSPLGGKKGEEGGTRSRRSQHCPSWSGRLPCSAGPAPLATSQAPLHREVPWAHWRWVLLCPVSPKLPGSVDGRAQRRGAVGLLQRR